MGSISKHQAMVKDRISGLPDAVLCHILSFLRTKYAVRTTVLSRRWKNIWTSVTCLNFNDDEDFNTTENGCYGSERFTTFVDRVLFSRDSSDIQKFRLAIRYPDGLARIDSWIWTAVRRNVVELDFHFQTDELIDFELPRSLVMCKTLKVLRLGSAILTCALPNPGYFPSLKFLHATVCYFDNDTISKLFSDCPLLEGLTIDGGIRAEEVLNSMISFCT